MRHLAVAGLMSLCALGVFSQSAHALPPTAFFPTGSTAGDLPVVRVQSADTARISQLEEQIRSLNGRIEEMSFQLLQMQEQIRKFQEDNEFRFQDLESGGAARKSGQVTPPPSGDGTASITPPATRTDRLSSGSDIGGQVPAAGVPETTLGSIIFDSAGNPVQSPLDPVVPGAEPGLNTTPDSQQQTAALDNPGDLYQSAYGHVLTGDYTLAEQEFRDYITNFPEGEKVADASFWMGEAQYSQGKFNEAAKTFLDSHQAYATSPKAPEMLLKLGMSLAALDNRDTACATLREVTKRYPQASGAIKAKVSSEQGRLGC